MVIPVDFIKFDYTTSEWVNNELIENEILNVDPIPENSSLFSNVVQDQTITVENSSIGSGIVGLGNVWNKTGEDTYEILNSTYYNYIIVEENGVDALNITYTDSTTVDLIVEYLHIPIQKLTQYAINSFLVKSTIKVLIDNSETLVYIDLPLEFDVDYNITGDNLNDLIFYTFYSSITPTYSLKDSFFIKYNAHLTEEVNPVNNMILEFLDDDGKWRPIEKVPLTVTGGFDSRFSIRENGLQFPLREERILRLVYLPSNLTNYNNEYLAVDYSGFNCVYNTTYSVEELFKLYVDGKESKIKYFPTEFSTAFDQWATVGERKYSTTTNPYETLHAGEPYTYFDFHRTITDEYEFQFQLTDEFGKFLENQVIFMEIGFKPKAGLNYKVIDWEDENGNYIDSEALGTAWFTDQGQDVCLGPGVLDYDYSMSRMYTRPETWEYLDPEGEVGQYSSYYWDYRITDKTGLVSFTMSLDDDYIGDHHRIFDESLFSSGSITFDSLDDYRLYARVVHAPIYDIGNMAFEDNSQLYCSQDNDVFDFSRISEFDGFDYSESTFYSGAYGEGLITLHPEDIMLGVPNLLIYQLGSKLNDTFSFTVEVAEADVIPDAELMTLGKLEQSFESNNLLLEYENNTYLIDGMPIVATITDYYGNSVFEEGNVQFAAYIDSSGLATFNISDHYLLQLDPGVYQVSIFTIPRAYTKDAYRFITLEVRPENWLKFGEPTMTLDLLNWFDSGWGGAYFGNDYAFYEDIYPRLTGYLATLHSEEGISDYADFSLYAKARDIDSTTDWDEVEWIELGDEDIYISSLVYDGLYYFEYPLGQDGDMLMGKEVILNITANAFYNQTGIIEGGRKQELYILNLTLVNSTIRNDSLALRSYSDTDSKDIWIGQASIEPYGVERYFEYTTDIDTYGIESDDVLLTLNGYKAIDIVEVRGQKEYNETILEEGVGKNYTISGDYTIILESGVTLDNHSDLIISYAINLYDNKVMNFTFSESEGFEFSEIILDTQNNPIELDHDKYLGVFYSKFNESYSLVSNAADLNIGFSGIETTDVKIFNVTNAQGQPIEDTYILSTDDDQITITFGSTAEYVFIEYGIATYSLDRGYQRIDMNFTDSVRKLSKFHDYHKIYNYSSSADVNLLTIPDDPQDPLEAGQPKILIPLLEDNKTTISFNYLALLYDSVLNGSFCLDDCVLSGDVQDLKPILATFTFTTEDGESYFDFVTIDPTTGENRFDFEINLQPMYAIHGYTTYDIEIDFLSYGDSPNTLQYVLFDKFELTADDRILQIVDKPMLTKKGDIDESQVINTAHYTQIFTDRLNEAYNVIDDALMTIAVEGFGDYGELVKLYRDEENDNQLTFEPIENNEYCFQNLPSHDYRLVDSLGLHIDAYDLDLPEYIEGEVNLYAGNGTYTYGEVYEDLEFSMNWDSTGYNDYTVDIDTFNAHDYNSDNFLLSALPLTGDYVYVEGELYLHHRVDLTTAELITSGLPENVEFAIVLPNTTSRIDSLSVKNIDRICHPWDWVESWQGFALTEEDYSLYNPDLAGTYNPSGTALDEGEYYDLVINDEGRDQLNFYFEDQVIINELLSNVIQIDFHIDYEFIESDYAIEEDANTYNSEIHWQLPDDSYIYWDQFGYHPDLTSTSSFNASFFRLSDYAPMDDYESSTIETFQFYPNEYNFTTFEFTGFTDNTFEVSLNLTYGGEFDDIIDTQDWDRIKPFGITIQTESGERYINDEFMYYWQHSSEPEHDHKPIYKFKLFRDIYEYIGLLNDTEVMVTYYYQKESLSYYTQHDDILYGGDYTFIIKDSDGNVMQTLGNVSSIVGNNITFTDNILSEELLDIGENFTVEYSFKTRGGLLDTKHFFVEVQPWDMKFYNSYYPFSGASILSPLYYNLSANYQYQLALNYRLQEKSILTFSLNLTTKDIQDNYIEYIFGDNIPIEDYDETPTAIAYFYNITADGDKVDIIEDLIDCSFTSVTINNIRTELGLIEEDIIYVSIIPRLHNKYQPFHNLIVNLTTDSIILTNWTLAQDPTNNLIANFETPYYIYDVDPYEATSKGNVKQIYAILNDTNYLTYYLTEDLNDPVDGWQDYDTLIMKLGFLNYDILDYLNVSFYYEDSGVHYIGSVNVTLDMIDTDSGEVNIKLPDSSSFSQFTVDNNAHITFTPMFYEHTDFLGFFYEDGYPNFQLIEWSSEDVVNGLLNIDLDNMAIEGQSVLVYNDLMEYLFEITDVDTRTEEYNYDGSTETYTLEFNNISLPEVFTDANGNTLVMREGDILYLKCNASLEKSIGITVEDMVLQKAPYIKSYETGLSDIPIAEISLLGINNDGITYSTDDLYENREKLVAWDISLDLTPFESKIENTYKQQVFNISFEDIYTEFKVLDSDNVENCYITDILVTSNDPRYELVVDSFFIFEFEENATLYDSAIFDIFPNNHIENFYVGNYSDIYNESIILDASSFLPLYSDDDNIDETLYFDVFDNVGNWYYFGSHLINESLGTGIYNITWNPLYSEEYYYAYINQYDDLDDLYDYYNPHIDTFRYLYISWADEDAWNEWQTIEQVNVNISTIDVTFEWYDETLEEYESVVYNQTLDEFEARHIAVEPIYPYDSIGQHDIFDLSQDYSNAQDLDIYKITGYFFNETEKDFDISLSNILIKSINITAPNGFNLDNFEKIIVYLNFTEGAYSDYTQFRLLQTAIDSYPEIPLWTKNDSIYVDFEYNDIDYFLLLEDYAVGSEDSMFEYLEYVRNDRYVSFDYSFDMLEEIGNFDSFTEVNDLTSVLELHDYDLDGTHELVVQKDDVSNSGLYDSFKYGSLNPAGEISFHTLIQEANTVQVYKDQSVDYSVSEGYQINWKDIWRKYYIFARRYLTTYTTVINTISSAGKLIQKDLDGDGIPDKELFFRATFSTTEVMTVSNETTHLHFRPTSNNPGGKRHDGYLIELRNSTTTYSSQSLSFMFKDFEGEEVVSTRLYEDIFPNELSEVYNLENNLYSITNDQNDEDPDNDITIDSPALEELLSLSHDIDPVSAIFDQVSMFENDEFTTENILAVNKSLTASGIYNAISGLGSQGSEHEFSVSVIEVKPNTGVYYDINTRFGPEKIEGSYYYFDENDDGRYITIFITDSDDNIIGIGFDNDKNLIFEPNDRQFVEKHIVSGGALGWKKYNYATGEEYYVVENYIKNKLVFFQDEDRYEGYFLEPTLSDSLFDVWKMQYNSGSSKLIKEQMSITSHQFLSSVTPSKFWGDIAWQMQAQGTAVAVGLILAGIVAVFTGGTAGKIAYYVGHFITYAICNAIHSYIQERDQDYYIRSQTFHNADYEGEVKLSDKLWKDRYFGDMVTDALLGSRSGTYAPVRAETDKHAYSGEVVLAPRGKKTSLSFTLDVSFRSLALDYSQQTRGYFAYSDLDDPRFISFFYDEIVAAESVTMLVSRNDKDKYMGNSIMYLEDMVHDATIENDDAHYDSIVPYMVYGDGTFVPVFQFADSEGSMPVPEFYDEYPIFLSPEQYELVDDEYHSIYKIYDGTSDTIQLIPEYSTHTLHSDIVSFDAYLCDGQGTEFFIGNYKNSDSYESFTFNSTSGEIILSPLQTYNLDCFLDNYEDPDAYIVLEFFIEKYRSVDDLRDLTAEEVENIATMQSAHANILEYMYQHTIATKTQQKLSEAAYTVLVTVISTLPFAIAGAIKGFTKGIAKGLYQFPKMLISEAFQELYIDPWIESYVSGYAEEHGWSTFWKSLAVSFAESSRETFGSTITTAFSNVFSTSNQAESQAQSVQSASQVKAARKSAALRVIALTALSTIMLFAGFISPVAMIFGTSASYIGIAAVSTVKEIRYKHLLNKIIDSYSEANVQNLLGILSPSKIADPQTALLHDQLSPIANKENSLFSDDQKNKGKPESLLQKTYVWLKHHKKQIAMYTGVAIAGFLTTIGINALFADSMFGSIGQVGAGLGFGTIGMVKDFKLDKHDSPNIEISLLRKPWEVVSHYYEEMGVCRQSPGSEYIRHNYIISERKGNNFVLKCKHCDATLQHTIDYTYRKRFGTPSYKERIEKIKLWEERQNLGPGDIIIYRMYWRKDASGSWLPFPGMNYEGKTEGSVIDRIYRDSKGHINSIRNFYRPIHRLIRNDFTFILDDKYSSFIDQARVNIKVEVLDIVRFQGDWAYIRSIQDSELQKQAINEAKKRTEEIASRIEIFFIGFYHTQFLEFGGNYEAGGVRGGRGTALLPFDTVDNAFNDVLYYNRYVDAKKKYIENLGLSYPTQEGKIISNLEAWYDNVRDHHFTTILGQKQADEADKYFRLGYNMNSIARIFNQKSGQQRVTDEYISRLLKDFKYKNTEFEGLDISQLKAVIYPAIIKNQVRNGITDYLSLLEVLPGFDRSREVIIQELRESGRSDEEITESLINEKRKYRIQNFIKQHFGSLTALVEELHPTPNYWNLARFLINNKGSRYTAVEFVIDLGFTASSSANAVRKIKKLYNNLTWKQLRAFILTRVLPDNFRESDFEGVIN